MLKKGLSFLLSLLMLLTLLPAVASAESNTQTPEGKKPFVRSKDSQKTFSSDALTIGQNTYVIETGGDTVYRPFVPPSNDMYTFFSVGTDDTYGFLLDNEGNEIDFNDDGGAGRNFSMDDNLNKGETYWIGARFYDAETTGTIEVVVEKHETVEFNGTVVWNREDVKFKGNTPYVIANGSAQEPRFTVLDENGSEVSASDYTYYYRENTAAGTGYVCVLMNETGAMLRGWFKIYLPATQKTYVENTDDGIKVTWEPVEGADGYVIYRRAWSTTTNGWTDFMRWDNTPVTTWYDGIDANHKVYAGTRYQYGVKAYFHRRQDPISGAMIGGNVGDNYNLGEVGPLKTTVRITSRELQKLVSGSRKITAYWSASKNFTGYQLQYATDSAFKNNLKTIKITEPKTSSQVVSSLSNNKAYYFRIRSYHEFEGMTYYGAWSNPLWIKAGAGGSTVPMRALIIGENRYPTNELKGRVNDMYTISGMLRGLKYPYYTKTLPNSTKDEILNAIRTQFKNTTDNDVSLFCFSGHGADVSGDATYHGALVSIDGQYITFAELAEELSKIKGHVIVLLDSSYSGAAIGKGRFDAEAFNRSAIDAFSAYETSGENSARSGELKKSKFIVITAAHSTQPAEEDYYDMYGYRESAFSAALIQGMGCRYPDGGYTGSTPADANGNGSVTLKELYDYICNTAIAWAIEQQAQYYGSDSAVLFVR